MIQELGVDQKVKAGYVSVATKIGPHNSKARFSSVDASERQGGLRVIRIRTVGEGI